MNKKWLLISREDFSQKLNNKMDALLKVRFTFGVFGKSRCQSLQIIPVSLQSLQIFPPSFPSTFLIFMDHDNSCSSIKVSIPLIKSVRRCWVVGAHRIAMVTTVAVHVSTL